METTKCFYCGKPAQGRKANKQDSCQACYRLWKRHGKVERTGPKPAISHEVIATLSVEVEGCRIWQEFVDADGYPKYYDGERYLASQPPLVNVRRWVVEQKIGRKLEKNEIAQDTCDQLLCVAPEHLEAVKLSEARRTLVGINSRKTHCINGHDYDVVGVYTTPEGRRHCMECRWQSSTRAQGKDPELLVRGPHNGDKTHCANGHEFDQANTAYRDDGSRVCRRCRIDRVRFDNYGLTPDQYIAMREAQNDSCFICGDPFTHNGMRTSAHVDHCHDCGEVRGIICDRCNLGLGNFRDSVTRMRAGIAYLEGHQARKSES